MRVLTDSKVVLCKKGNDNFQNFGLKWKFLKCYWKQRSKMLSSFSKECIHFSSLEK